MTKKSSVRILIVDDNLSQGKTMAAILMRIGHAVTIAIDGLEAIQKVKESPYDIVFMDIKMPVMNGVEAYRQIKIIRPGTVVMMMTAYAMEELVQQALDEGAYGILYKPLDIERVIAFVEEAKQRKSGAFILIVDDDPGICKSLRDILTKKSYQVGIAPTGMKALSMVQQEDYDIIFIDMKLPVLNGLETYRAIREIKAQTVAIMMTGYRCELIDLVDEALCDDAYACLTKPLNIDELLRLVEEIWERKQLAGENLAIVNC
ncbi:MAG: response regulator [Anaerolineales bacterium]|nr:MAG: response regulator [Anaerolineales bacterium]